MVAPLTAHHTTGLLLRSPHTLSPHHRAPPTRLSARLSALAIRSSRRSSRYRPSRALGDEKTRTLTLILTLTLTRPSRALGDGKLVRSEFVDLCIDVMWGLPVANLEMAVQNYLGAKSMEKRRNAAYWQAATLTLALALAPTLAPTLVPTLTPTLAPTLDLNAAPTPSRRTAGSSTSTAASSSASPTASSCASSSRSSSTTSKLRPLTLTAYCLLPTAY